MVQMENETVSQYCARIRKAGGNRCNYHNVNDQIRDQIVEYCVSDVLRERLIEGNALILERTLVLASTHESVERRFREMSSRPLLNRVNDNRPGINRSSNGFRGGRTGLDRGNRVANEFQGKARCNGCGRENSHAVCAAKGRQCFKCKEYNYFKSVRRGKHVNYLKQNDEDCSDRPDAGDVGENSDRFAFTLNSVNKEGLYRAVVQVGGVDVKLFLDSGADCNVIDKSTWETLKKGGIVVERSERSGPKIYSYTSQKSLSVIGSFGRRYIVLVIVGWPKIPSFLVIDTMAEALLGIETCTELGLISISTNLVVEERVA
ncbi:uncharacterized protein [Watersipora subatra]|uniref:uncharacterized protein n=1 Tax=Watersipora subatra TaxID=2589382 RepID=UPI00355BD8D5